MPNIDQRRSEIEQLQREANVKRMPLSEAIGELKTFVMQHEQDDCLVHGFTSSKGNPFVTKHSCKIF